MVERLFFVPINNPAEKHKIIKRLTKRGYPRGSFRCVRYISRVVVKNKKGGVNNENL